jgi:hypothetical protein
MLQLTRVFAIMLGLKHNHLKDWLGRFYVETSKFANANIAEHCNSNFHDSDSGKQEIR